MVRNLTKECVLAVREKHAGSFPERLRGLIGHDFSSFDAMLFASCNAIHTFFMAFPIDVIFADREKKVRKTVKNFPPNRLYAGCSGAFWTIELPQGTLEKTGTGIGDVLDF